MDTPFFNFRLPIPFPHPVVFPNHTRLGVTNGAFEEWNVLKYYETIPLALLILLGNRMFFVADRILNNRISSCYHDQWFLQMITYSLNHSHTLVDKHVVLAYFVSSAETPPLELNEMRKIT